MGNKHRGETTFLVEGKSYTLRFSMDALANLEDDVGTSFQSFMAALVADDAKPKTRLIQKLFFYGLQEYHPELTLRDVGRLGTPAEISKLVFAGLNGDQVGDEPALEAKTDSPT
jgi:hypothetical protein